MWPWLGIWDAGNVSVRTLVLWDNLRRICDSAAVISTGRGYWGWQTGPDWIAGHFPPDTRRLWCLLFAARWQLVLLYIFACPTLHWQTTHIWKNVLPGLSFLKNVAHLSIPQPIWTPLDLGNPAMIVVWMCFLVCGLAIETLCKLIPKSQYHLKKFTCSLVLSCMKSINALEFILHSSGVTGNLCNSIYICARFNDEIKHFFSLFYIWRAHGIYLAFTQQSLSE